MDILTEESEPIKKLFHELNQSSFSTVFSTKVLIRPPFPFIHKLCVEVLSPNNIFTTNQLDLMNLTTRELKAGFLVRSLAFVTFFIRRIESDAVSVLLYVSPVQLLAGLEVERTHEFLRQLAITKRSKDSASKDLAAQEVLSKGESDLYTMAMKFRRGLVKAQAAVRFYLVNQRKQLDQRQPPALKKPIVGDRILKEFEGFGVFQGVIRSIHDGIYVVYYAQDDDEEELDEDEMMEVLTRSRELEMGSKEIEDSQEAISTHPMHSTAENDQFDMKPIDLFGSLLELPTKPQELKESQSEGFLDNEIPIVDLSTTKTRPSTSVPSNHTNSLTDSKEDELEIDPPWRQKILTLMKQGSESPISLELSNNNPMHHMPPSLPSITVPGGIENWKKRLKQIKKISNEKKNNNLKLLKKSNNQKTSPLKNLNELKKNKINKKNNNLFQTISIEEKKNEKKIVSTILMRIDKYLRRKRMRVIDLFRYCDFDHSGYISHNEMEEVLHQMDIRFSSPDLAIFMHALDKNKNGVVDVDEFESLVRVYRRTDARRDQLRQELPQVIKNKSKNISNGIKFHKIILHREKLFQYIKLHDIEQSGTIPIHTVIHGISTLIIPKLKDIDIDLFIQTCRPLHGLILICDIYQILYHSTVKENRFLDHTWLNQFDIQMEKVRRLGN